MIHRPLFSYRVPNYSGDKLIILLKLHKFCASRLRVSDAGRTRARAASRAQLANPPEYKKRRKRKKGKKEREREGKGKEDGEERVALVHVTRRAHAKIDFDGGARAAAMYTPNKARKIEFRP